MPVYYGISGTVLGSDGNPAERTIRLFDEATGALLDETTSDATTGAYAIELPDDVTSRPVYAIALADIDSENDRVLLTTTGLDQVAASQKVVGYAVTGASSGASASKVVGYVITTP